MYIDRKIIINRTFIKNNKSNKFIAIDPLRN